MQNLLFCDLETYSDIPINCGTHRYAENAEILLFAYGYNHAPVKVWDVTQDKTMPTDLKGYLDDREIVTVWHNGGMFDTVILKHVLNIDLHLSRVHDTLVQALAHGLPGALGSLCDIFNVNSDKAKDKEGKALIQLFCKPRPKNSKIQRATALTHFEEWQRFKTYAGSDILAMREIYQHLPRWNMNADETELWQLDQTINRRGMSMDVELAKSALTAVENEQKRLSTVTQQLTGNAVQAATQRDALLQHITSAFGITLPDMQASTLQRRINDPNIPQALRELLSVRLQSCTTSTSKYKALLVTVLKVKLKIHEFDFLMPEVVLRRYPLMSLTADILYSAVIASPFQGKLLSEWAEGLEKDRMTRINNTVRNGYLKGDSAVQIGRNIRGDAKRGYKDGALQISRANATSIAKTAINHLQATARNQFAEANKNMLEGKQWLSTLDNKTSPACIIRDRLRYTLAGKPIGHKVAYLQGPGKIHWNCRSTETWITKSWRQLGMDVDEIDEGTRASMDGQIPVGTTFLEWIQRQPVWRQKQVFGEVRYRLMKEGGMHPSEFYTDKGEFISLAQLRKIDEQAFNEAGMGI